MNSEYYINIKLAALLKRKRMTKRELARLADVRHTLIWEMCHNKTKRLPLDKLAKICEVLDVEITDIMELAVNKKDAS